VLERYGLFNAFAFLIFDFRLKTTLLNVLAERAGTGIITGDRFFNGQALPVDFQAQTGYCQQMDTHVPLTTVREALVFSARLRQPASVPTSEKDA
jgi:ATP-binding cassette subfamily G (WHITE) protein 2 (SNQ2)